MDIIQIEMFPAKKGDVFLLRFDNKNNILIDMGYRDTYTNYIRDRLIQIKNEGQCIDLLVITHIDQDHIEGAIEFFKENGNCNNSKIVEVKEIWHNSYRHLQFDKEKRDKISNFETHRLEEIILANSNRRENTTNESKQIKAKHGSTLAGYLYGFDYEKRWNTKFNHKAVNLDNRREIEFDYIKIYMLSPNTDNLKRLSNKWLKELRKFDFDFNISDEKIFDDAYEMYLKKIKPLMDVNDEEKVSYRKVNFKTVIDNLIESTDNSTSESNESSIAFIIEYKNVKVLFLGDADESIILNGLNKYNNLGNELDFDVIKLSHHGSIRNNYNLIDIIKAKRYLISTNGKSYGHPDENVIAKIIMHNKEHKELYFNYPIKMLEEINDIQLREKYNYSINIGDGESSMIVGVKEKNE
ncbi:MULTISPECIES: MBL fold metallo-hydrolase [unclassified Clostridium]|uniref:MBL fold metallo-hydrolase n=1 Tax=unclassified Clostridium TaxID=2614128 RepID=UPI0013F7FE0B|nr:MULTISPECIES: MBL fold metallo-hydrolase [unclassified Clostridium]MBN1038262.1 hypothetical protein [Clostridium botulinum]NFR86167.1 hypothetical protein [Clostridium botulinum]NFR88917.1 hypothetical protein [Clostridium botulinum]NFT98738.1 hypothetical protein [Clostridium botulinum]